MSLYMCFRATSRTSNAHTKSIQTQTIIMNGYFPNLLLKIDLVLINRLTSVSCRICRVNERTLTHSSIVDNVEAVILICMHLIMICNIHQFDSNWMWCVIITLKYHLPIIFVVGTRAAKSQTNNHNIPYDIRMMRFDDMMCCGFMGSKSYEHWQFTRKLVGRRERERVNFTLCID